MLTVLMKKEEWTYDGDLERGEGVTIKEEGSGLSIVNNNNSVEKIRCLGNILVTDETITNVTIEVKGKILSNAGGFILINSVHEVPVNGVASMPIDIPVELNLEIAINAKSSVSIEEISFSYFDADNKLIDSLDDIKDVLVVTPAYPSYKNLYLSAFAHARNKAYVERGLKVQEASLNNSWYSMKYDLDDVSVYCGKQSDLKQLILRKQYKTIIVHFVDEALFRILDECMTNERIIFICHGPETLFSMLHNKVRPYFTEPLPEPAVNAVRSEYIKAFSKKKNVEWVFVSEWLRQESEKLLNHRFKRSHVIGNYINECLFPYHEKKPEDRKKIMVIRKFDNIQ